MKSQMSGEGYVYAMRLLSKIPVPQGATQLETPIQPIHPVTGSLGYRETVDVTNYYLLPKWFGVSAFAESRFPRSDWQGTGSTSDGGYHTSDSFLIMSLCPDRHAAFCGATYSAQELAGRGMELRIDVAVIWLPVQVVHLPTTGVVTITGYQRISLMNQSSGPVQVTLTSTEVAKLRSALEDLRNSPGGLCMEDSLLYKISVVSTASGRVFWSAIADECPGTVTVSSQLGRVLLNGRSCPLDRLIASFFPVKAASGTRIGLRACQMSY
ncbi:MAG: hypothetical protein ACHQFZ_04595 [Acidimicrobiales bacterium]